MPYLITYQRLPNKDGISHNCVFTRPWLVEFNEYYNDGIQLPEINADTNAIETYNNSLIFTSIDKAQQVIDWFISYLNNHEDIKESIILQHYADHNNYSILEVSDTDANT
jgi:hypothetical protein